MIPAQDLQFMGASEDVQIMGPAEPATAEDYISIMHGFGASSPQEVMCAEQVKGEFYGSAACSVGMIGSGLFGVYKLFKGKPAAGVTSLAAGAVLYFIGGALATVMAKKYTACTGTVQNPAAAPTIPKLPPL